MINIQELFRMMAQCDASDLYLRTSAYPRMRIHGKIEVMGDSPLTRSEMLAVANMLLSQEEQQRKFVEKMDIDFIYVEPNVGRFRVNLFMQRGTPALVARRVYTHVDSFEDLNLPADLLKIFCEEKRGMMLVCGPAGNGKSTTIATMIEYINKTQSKHVITIEDPIEYLFKDKKSLINQRELGLDVPSYGAALKHVTQQSPDIIYIGTIRDDETMRAAITSAELGAFVMTTFHTINTVQTIIRMVNFYPPYLHDEVRMRLSLLLKGSISLRLVPCVDGNGRIPAYETMVVTPTIARLIRENRINEIQGFIDQGELFGMQSFRKSLLELVASGKVKAADAREFADSKDEFDLALKGIKSKFD